MTATRAPQAILFLLALALANIGCGNISCTAIVAGAASQ